MAVGTAGRSSPAAHIASLGARTAVGLNATATAAACRAGVSRIQSFPFWVSSSQEVLAAACVPNLDASMSSRDRMVAMAAGAASEALCGLVRSDQGLASIPAFVALPEDRIGFDQSAANRVMSGLAAEFRDVPVEWHSTGRGHAGGIAALKQAMSLLRRADVDLCLVGGVDSYFDPLYLGALLEQRALHSEGTRGGFTPGEGAGFLLLMSERMRRMQQWRSLGGLCSAELAREPCSPNGDKATRGDGLTRAVTAACAGLQLPDDSPGMVFCDINGERFRSEEWGFMLMRMAPHLHASDYTTAAGSWGDVGAASAPLLTVLASQSWTRRYAASSRALIWCASFGGDRGALLLEQPVPNPEKIR